LNVSFGLKEGTLIIFFFDRIYKIFRISGFR